VSVRAGSEGAPGRTARGGPSGDGRRVVVAAPMRLEAWLIRAGARGVALHRTGIGPRRGRAAGRALHALLGPDDLVLVLGFGGGLQRGARPGEAVVAAELRGPRGEGLRCAAAQPLVRELEAAGIAVRAGVVCSAERPVLGAARARLAASGALAVDMESYWLACELKGSQWAVVRVLSDAPRDGRPRPWRAAVGFARACATLRAAAGALATWQTDREAARLGGVGTAPRKRVG
jgi:4-hydroxy-3-methylbut-2-enyl diphosphate reductase